MKKIPFTALLLLLLWSCKNDMKEGASGSITEDSLHHVSQEVIDRGNTAKVRGSLMSKIMVTEELGEFASSLVSASLNEMLATSEGPFTVFAPRSTAFDSLSVEGKNSLLSLKNKPLLNATLKSHIINGSVTTAEMVQELRTKDTLVYESLSGKSLKVVKNGNGLQVIGEDGKSAKIGKSDIMGNNGTLHVIDQVFGIN